MKIIESCFNYSLSYVPCLYEVGPDENYMKFFGGEKVLCSYPTLPDKNG